MIFTGRNGTLRIYDSTVHVGNRGVTSTVDVVKLASSVYSNISTAAVTNNDANRTGTLFVASGDAVFIGCTKRFACIRISTGTGGTYCTGGGALRMYYYNGTDWTTEITDIVDETYTSPTTMAKAEAIGFKAPEDWTIGQGGLTDLDTDKYYVKLVTTSVPSVPPDLDYLVPVDMFWIDVVFADMNFDGIIGRGKTEELLILNRGTMDGSYAHFIEGSDYPEYEPLQITFSYKIDDTWNKGNIIDVLTGTALNIDTTNGYWNGSYTSSKGDTMNDGTNKNPTFVDSNKKCCNIQMLWETSTGYVGFAYYEVYFPKEQIKISEADDGVTVSCTGFVYGVIEKIHHLACRYT